MPDLILCKFLKLKHSKNLIISFLGALVTPLMMLVDGFKIHYDNPDMIIAPQNFYHDCLVYTIIAFGLLVAVVIGSYIFSREYGEKTLNNILPLPVGRRALIGSKFIALLLILLVFSLISWLTMTVVAYIFNLIFEMAVWDIAVVLQYLVKMLVGGLLIFLLITPFVFLAISSKGYILPVIVASAVVLANAGLMNETWGALFPWTSACLLVSGGIEKTGYPYPLVVGSIALVELIGIVLTMASFCHEDIK